MSWYGRTAVTVPDFSGAPQSSAPRPVQERTRFEASREQREELATRFFAAAEEGDLQGLEELLAHDVVFRGDGGGKAPAAARAIHGRARVARTLIAGLRALARFGGFTTRREEVNGQPGALFFDREGRLISVAILDIAEGQIQAVSSIATRTSCATLGRWPTCARCCASEARFFSLRARAGSRPPRNAIYLTT